LQSGSSGHNVVVAGIVVATGAGVVVVVIGVAVVVTFFIINGICNGKIGAGYIGFVGSGGITGGFVVSTFILGLCVVTTGGSVPGYIDGTSVVTVHGGGGVV